MECEMLVKCSSRKLLSMLEQMKKEMKMDK